MANCGKDVTTFSQIRISKSFLTLSNPQTQSRLRRRKTFQRTFQLLAYIRIHRTAQVPHFLRPNDQICQGSTLGGFCRGSQRKADRISTPEQRHLYLKETWALKLADHYAKPRIQKWNNTNFQKRSKNATILHQTWIARESLANPVHSNLDCQKSVQFLGTVHHAIPSVLQQRQEGDLAQTFKRFLLLFVHLGFWRPL